MPRKKRPLDRDSGVLRDASLLVIASEDTFAVKQYFQRFRTRRVQFIVVNTEDSRSSPADVIARLDRFRQEYATEEGDQFWLCIDTDHWTEPNHIANLVQVLQHCRQKDYRLAISNPCFELWLLLHFADYVPASQITCKEITKQLAQLAGGYSKKCCGQLPLDAKMVMQAVKRAKNLDVTDDLLPNTPLTRVYCILEELLNRDAIDIA